MVLQRDKNVSIFGEGENGAKVSVEFAGKTVTATVRDEKWLAVLPPMGATTVGEELSMTVRCGEEEKLFTNVAVGEVWLAGGQSNMELELQNCKGGKDFLANDKDVNVRFYYTQKNAFIDEKFLSDEANSCWKEFDSESARCWSAVGYFFAKKLAAELGITVGIVGCNWGGTSASAWMSREALSEDVNNYTYVTEYDKAIEGKSPEQQDAENAEYEAYSAEWNKKSEEYYRTTPNATWDGCVAACGECKYPGPHGRRNPFHAAALYDSMLMRVCPYTLRGFIYYQGESDDHKPRGYYNLFTRMIRLWRSDWRDDELPFILVQLPMHCYAADPDYKHWCLIREAQDLTYRTIKNTGMAVILDCGEFNEIHPKNKVPVGERLAAIALHDQYGKSDIKAYAPMYKSMFIDGDKITLSFDNASDGFEVKGEISGFEIAGADKKFVCADAVITGSKIIVSAEGVAEPLYVRYLWTNYAEVTIFGRNGVPLAPFRTSRNDEGGAV